MKGEENMLVNIMATDHEGCSFSFLLDFEGGVEICSEEAVKEAVNEFLCTDKGLQIFVENNRHFNWGDFLNDIPQEICEHYGFKVIRNDADQNIVVDANESLVDPDGPYFTVSRIVWDTDGEDVDLPDVMTVYHKDLLNEGEKIGGVDVEELKDRIADHISDETGFCVEGFDVWP